MRRSRPGSKRVGEGGIVRPGNLAPRLAMLRRALRILAETMNAEIQNEDRQTNGDTGDQMPSWREVFFYFLFLGFVNIGGPVAQITMMFNHMVEKRQWVSRDRFLKITALCQLLPGPEAIQLAIYVGYLKRKDWGGVLAGLTFILPGAAVMIFLSWLYVRYGQLPQGTKRLFRRRAAGFGIFG